MTIAISIFGALALVTLAIPSKPRPIKVEEPTISRASLEFEANASPCDEDHIVALVRLIHMREGDGAALLRARAHRDRFIERCGPMPRLAREIDFLTPDAGAP